jgi:cystathionine beta-lyase/cystathionine gamma-synthase
MVSFTLKGDDFEAAMRFATSVEIFTLAESLGGVESLVNQFNDAFGTYYMVEDQFDLTNSKLRLFVE